jgi:hypothetical protein
MLKPIDIQQIIIQTDQTAKVQHVLQQHPEMQQRYLEIQSREQRRLIKKTVRNAEETKQLSIRDDQEKEKQGKPFRHSDKPIISHDEEMGQEMPQQGEHINIKV